MGVVWAAGRRSIGTHRRSATGPGSVVDPGSAPSDTSAPEALPSGVSSVDAWSTSESSPRKSSPDDSPETTVVESVALDLPSNSACVTSLVNGRGFRGKLDAVPASVTIGSRADSLPKGERHRYQRVPAVTGSERGIFLPLKYQNGQAIAGLGSLMKLIDTTGHISSGNYPSASNMHGSSMWMD